MHLLPFQRKEELEILKLSVLSTPLFHLLCLTTIPCVLFVEDLKFKALGLQSSPRMGVVMVPLALKVPLITLDLTTMEILLCIRTFESLNTFKFFLLGVPPFNNLEHPTTMADCFLNVTKPQELQGPM
jgi:hypothetical protein